MRQYLNALSIICATSFITACSGDDDGNKEANAIAAQTVAVEAQTAAFEQQAAIEAAPITLTGVLTDLSTGQSVETGSVTLTIGNTSREAIPLENGVFLLEQIPSQSSYELLFESDENEFLARAFYGVSRYSEGQAVFEDLGVLNVSPAQTLLFSVTNASDESTIPSLTFYADSSVGESSRSILRRHQSEYDATLNQYRITLPTEINLNLRADIDFDGDDFADFDIVDLGYLYGTSFSVDSFVLRDFSSFQLSPSEDTPLNSLEIRLAIVDDTLTPIPGLESQITFNDYSDTSVTYDESTGQYSMVGEFDSSIEIVIPSFTVAEKIYQSSSVSVYAQTSSNVLYAYGISYSNTNNRDSYYEVSATQDSLDLVIQPREQMPSSDIAVVLKTEGEALLNGHQIFYSSPIELTETSAQLYRVNDYRIVRGNDSPSDFVPPGTTSYEELDTLVDSNATLSLNNTLLSVAPASELAESITYRYEINDIIDAATDIEFDAYSDNSDEFFIPSQSSFDINDVAIDNFNGTTNGNIIVGSNTAGSASTITNLDRYSYLTLPRSISSLVNLQFVKTGLIEDGTSSPENHTINVVEDGDVRADSRYHINIADNETWIDNSASYSSYRAVRGGNLGDTFVYRMGLDEYISDNTDSEINTMTLIYTYETMEGEIETGELTLPVQ